MSIYLLQPKVISQLLASLTEMNCNENLLSFHWKLLALSLQQEDLHVTIEGTCNSLCPSLPFLLPYSYQFSNEALFPLLAPKPLVVSHCLPQFLINVAEESGFFLDNFFPDFSESCSYLSSMLFVSFSFSHSWFQAKFQFLMKSLKPQMTEVCSIKANE